MEKEQHYLKKELDTLVQEDNRVFDFLEHAVLDGLWYWDLQNPDVEWMNDDFWTLLGYDHNEKKHLASEWQDLIFKEDFELSIDNFNKHLANPDYPYDQIVRYYHKNGSTVWVRCRGLAIRDEQGTPIRMIGAHNDMTEIMKTQMELKNTLESLEKKKVKRKQELQRYTQLYENMADGFVVTDLEGNIFQTNQAYLDMVGYSTKQLYNLNFKDISVRKAIYTNIETKNLELVKSRGYSDWFEKEYIHKDGHHILVEIRVYFVEKYDGIEDAMWAIIKDISEREKAITEKELQEQMLIQQSKLASMGEMLNAIAHQWRQPLNILNGTLNNVADAYKHNELSHEYFEDMLEIAGKNIQYMSQTINDFKNFFQPSSNDEYFEIHEAIKAVESIIGEQLKANDIDLSVNIYNNITVHGAKNALEHVIINLINNAKDSILDVINSNNLQKNRGFIRLDVKKLEKKILISISDNGKGIDTEVKERIFEPYFTTKDEGKGSGIGLYLSRSVLQKSFSGFLELQNSSKEGSTFLITIPYSKLN